MVNWNKPVGTKVLHFNLAYRASVEPCGPQEEVFFSSSSFCALSFTHFHVDSTEQQNTIL